MVTLLDQFLACQIVRNFELLLVRNSEKNSSEKNSEFKNSRKINCTNSIQTLLKNDSYLAAKPTGRPLRMSEKNQKRNSSTTSLKIQELCLRLESILAAFPANFCIKNRPLRATLSFLLLGFHLQ